MTVGVESGVERNTNEKARKEKKNVVENLPGDRVVVSLLSCHASTINVNVPWKWRNRERKNQIMKTEIQIIITIWNGKEYIVLF